MCVACRIQGRGAPSLRMAPCLVYLWYGCSAVWCWSDSSLCRLLLLPFFFPLQKLLESISCIAQLPNDELCCESFFSCCAGQSVSPVSWNSVLRFESLSHCIAFSRFTTSCSCFLFSCCESHIGHSRQIYFPYFSPIFSTAITSLLFYVRFLQYYLAAL